MAATSVESADRVWPMLGPQNGDGAGQSEKLGKYIGTGSGRFGVPPPVRAAAMASNFALSFA